MSAPSHSPRKRQWLAENREKVAAYQRDYSAKNREKIAEKGKAWHEANREKRLHAARAAYQRDREKRLAEQKAYRAANKEKLRAARLQRVYGLAPEEQAALFVAHGNACAICGGAGGKRGLFVDHDHATGRVRGVLCEPCNTGIGRMKDDPSRLRRAAEYVERGGLR